MLLRKVYRGYKVNWRNFLVKPQYFPNTNDIRPYSDPTVVYPNTIPLIFIHMKLKSDDDL